MGTWKFWTICSHEHRTAAAAVRRTHAFRCASFCWAGSSCSAGWGPLNEMISMNQSTKSNISVFFFVSLSKFECRGWAESEFCRWWKGIHLSAVHKHHLVHRACRRCVSSSSQRSHLPRAHLLAAADSLRTHLRHRLHKRCNLWNIVL